MRRARPLPVAFFERDPATVAPELLNKLLACGDTVGRIVEVEAYRGTDDPASHAFGGPTPRARIMFERPGRLYVYLSYGVHRCANAVAHEPGRAGAVLVRALDPVAGIETMRARRPAARRDTDLASGPGKLCQALGIDFDHLGADLTAPDSPVQVLDDAMAPPSEPRVGPRVGITRAVDEPLRFSVPANPHRSRPW